eukprot:7780597-Alexandrium_andersonii.AAC.1
MHHHQELRLLLSPGSQHSVIAEHSRFSRASPLHARTGALACMPRTGCFPHESHAGHRLAVH